MSYDPTNLGGWVRDPEAVAAVLRTMPRPFFADAARHLKGTGAARQVLLYKAWKDVLGDYVRYPAQQIGCCVSRGFSEGVDLLQCVQIAIGHQPESYQETSHEAVYGIAREIGNSLKRPGRFTDGAVGAWAAKGVTVYGTVSREVTGPYSDDKAGDWGWHGVPADIKAQLGQHKVKTASLVSTWDEMADAIANGYPVPVCSDRGFRVERDSQGFCRASGTWDHCMLICGIRADREGACILQSWGINDGPPGPYGPIALDQPPNSFWADRRDIEYMLSCGDTFALSTFDGYPGQALPSSWTYAGFA